MSRTRVIALTELMLAAAAAVGSVWSWLAASSVADVAPVIAGELARTSVLYDPSYLAFSLSLATLAGVLVVLGVGRWRRGP